MVGPLTRILIWCTVLGFFATVFGAWHCIKGHNYAVAAQHEATTVGRVVGMYYGKGSSAYHYEFSVNAVRMDDYSEICATPLAPGACDHHGPVLVYYSYQPFQNSLLEDFAVASARPYRFGKPALAIGLPLFVLSIAALVVLSRKGRSEAEPDPGQ
jgi:hypothetical protein